MSSCNKTFKQVLSFFPNLTSALLVLQIGLYTYLKFEKTDSKIVQMLLQTFSDTPI